MATQIRPWLRVGPQTDVPAERARGSFILNVLEAEPTTPYDAWIPVLRADGEEVVADPAKLDRVAAEVQRLRDEGRVVYLHCGQGMERSPMTIAWVLWRAGEAKSFDAAYDEVQRVHRDTQRRDSWIPWAARHGLPGAGRR